MPPALSRHATALLTLGARPVVRVLLTLAAAIVVYAAAAPAFRWAEACISVRLLELTGFSGAHAVYPDLVEVFPPHQVGFTVVVTASCSALASIVSVGFLSTLLPVAQPRRLLGAAILAVMLIFIGNLARITASLAVGYWSGTASLVLFHDWVGGVFGSLYVLIGFILLLRLLLPRSASSQQTGAERVGL